MNNIDKELFEKLKSGSEKAFDSIFKKYYAGLCLFARKYIFDLEASEEVVQNLFVKLWEKKSSITFHSSLKAYLFTSVRNSCIDYIRHLEVRNRYTKEFLQESQQNNPDLNNNIMDQETIDKIYSSIDKLPKQRQKIFKMNRFEGLKYREIAEVLNLSIKTVEAHMGSALKQLREMLKDVNENY